MKKFDLVKNQSQKKHHLINRSANSSVMSFEDLYEDISYQWEEKARRLQARRWRKIKHQLV